MDDNAITVVWLIAAFGAGWFATITGVAVGAFFVFKTKRESWESVIAPSNKAEVFNMDDDWSKQAREEAQINEQRPNEGRSGLPVPEVARFMDRNLRAKQRMEAEIAARERVVQDAEEAAREQAQKSTIHRMPDEGIPIPVTSSPKPESKPSPEGAAFSLAPDEGKRDGE